jgi:NitT/TauT family transport system permease protein
MQSRLPRNAEIDVVNSTLSLMTVPDVGSQFAGGELGPQVEAPVVRSAQAPQQPAPSSNVLADAFESIEWLGLLRSWTVGALSLAIGVLLWQLACAYKLNLFIRFENVPTPIAVLSALIRHLHEEKFYIHILVSIRRILIGFTLATVTGIGLGILMGRSRTVRDVVIPYIEILRPIPAVAWIPLAILMWPTEESSIIYITFLGALFPIVLNTVHGVEQTPEVLIRAAQSLGAKRLQIFRNVVMPAALPSIATGLAIGMGVSWFSLLAGEIISGQYGIGYFTWNAYSLIEYPDIVVGMLTIGLLGTLSTMAVRKIMQPLLSWQRKSR